MISGGETLGRQARTRLQRPRKDSACSKFPRPLRSDRDTIRIPGLPRQGIQFVPTEVKALVAPSQLLSASASAPKGEYVSLQWYGTPSDREVFVLKKYHGGADVTGWATEWVRTLARGVGLPRAGSRRYGVEGMGGGSSRENKGGLGGYDLQGILLVEVPLDDGGEWNVRGASEVAE